MTRQPFESEFLYGLHEHGGEHLMADQGVKGWILFTDSIGSDPNNRNGDNRTQWSNQGYGIISRLNNGYQPAGTIPHSSQYGDFAKRCGNFVAATPGCKIWIIGNEMNYWVERPGAETRGILPATRGLTAEDEHNVLRGLPDRFAALYPDLPQSRSTGAGEVITPEMYARCYKMCRDAIKAQPGHGDDLVLIGSVAPWNNQTTYPGNDNGDWVQYFGDILKALGPTNCDGFTLHAYTHAADPNQIFDDVKMSPPFQNRHYNFRAYQDFMKVVPQNMRHLACYITEADQDVAWENRNTQWVQRAYGEIDFWNKQAGNQQIRALILYRWPNVSGDRWAIDGRAGVHEDFREAVKAKYRWNPDAVVASSQPVTLDKLQVGGQVSMATIVNLRKSAGYMGKPPADKIGEIPEGAAGTVMAGPQQADGLAWWQVRTQDADGRPVTGWAAQADAEGNLLLAAAGGTTVPSTPSQPTTPTAPNTSAPGGRPMNPSAVKPGMHISTANVVNLRRSAGYMGKPITDLVAEVPIKTQGVVLDGPQQVDGLSWFRVACILADGGKVTGWMAAADTAGNFLFLSSTETPQPSPAPISQPAQPAIQGKFSKGQQITVSNFANLRKSAGYVNKNPDDVTIDILINTPATVLGGPVTADKLIWWQIRSTGSNRATVEGWVAEADSNGATILSAGAPAVAAPAPTPVPSTAQIKTYSVADMVVNISGDIVNLRNSPGYVGKPASDVISQLPDQAALVVKEGPRDADGLVWWKVSGSVPGASRVEGWLAEAAPNGVRLMAPSQFSRILKVGTPFVGSFAMSQGWGSNPQFYAQFPYDGVPLKGHNGLDFGTPVGTRLVSPDSGEVIRVDFEAGGFGNFVLIRHRWGESLCAHMNRVTVSVGQTLERGTPIGESGNTGAGSGPHLHFGIRITPYRRTDGWGGFTDPRPFMDPNDIVGTRGGVETPEPMAPEVPGRSRP